ncbi:MAG TPA: S41 family peptidase [Salinivirgaceae bacterium]|nr:S41 family peptidase [Salinivirgaceae bacterium]
MNLNTKTKILLPTIVAASIVVGMITHKVLFQKFYANAPSNFTGNKLNELLKTVVENYVDTLYYDSLVEKTIPTLIEQLDPHSIYIPAKDREAVDEPIRGNFEGIGIQFNIRNDTVHVINTISGGPSEKVGIRGGDRIVKVNDTVVAGVKITNDQIMSKLKGPKGTKVKVTIARPGIDKPLDFEIIRDKIPIYSVETGYLIRPKTGYIKIDRFSMNTYREFIEKVKLLKKDGARQFIIDLRGNGGGVMQDAIQIADEFLSAGKIIVYTQGQARPRFDFYSSARGLLQNDPLVILIDEFSASASEILAGAIQDNDRGTIVGRRSFGKGLVQEPIYFKDGSELRLTVARYYTPTGRCIQKPYDNEEDYTKDILRRFQRGEFKAVDSIKLNENDKYYTPAGKVVYGGGGIMPDIFVPIDTSQSSKFTLEAQQRGLEYQFSYDFADKHRNELSAFTDPQKLELHLDKINIISTFAAFAVSKNIKANDFNTQPADKYYVKQIKALIIRNILGDSVYYRIMNEIDPTVNKALEVLNQQ